MDSVLIFVADHRCDPAEPFQEGEAFKEAYINRFEETKRPLIKRWDRNTFLPEQRAHSGEMKLTMLQLLKFGTNCFNIAD